MARNLATKPNIDGPDSDYPYGRIRDRVPGSIAGTRVDEEAYGDMHQFFAKMFASSGLTYNDLPDNDYSGFQFYEALVEVIKIVMTKITSEILLASQSTSSGAFVDMTGLTYTTPNDGITRNYIFMFKGVLRQAVSAGDGVTLQLYNQTAAAELARSTSYLDIVATNVDLNQNTVYCHKYVSLPPATEVRVRFNSISGGSMQMDENSFLIMER